MCRFGRTVACFHYAAINVKSVHIPPSIIDFHHNNLEWINKEANEVQQPRIELQLKAKATDSKF